MSIQTIEFSGERYVILPEREFLELQRKVAPARPTNAESGKGERFKEVVPLRVGGQSASDMLMQDRR